ncbi:MMPL family transporter [Corynebacterium mastitidis]|uniref:MMPL family transporter n=1 Tax=Corynebacterium mastitidis TaxID=161890 RepID=A0ABU8NV89_9CORY
MKILPIVQRNPRKLLAAWALFFVVTGALATQLNGAVKAGGFTDSRADSVTAQDIAQEVFGDPENQLIVVLSGESAVPLDILDQAVAAAESIDNVGAVIDSRSVPSLASESGNTQVLQIGFDADNTTTQNSVPELRGAIETALAGTGVQSHVTGAAALDYDLNMQSQRDALHAEFIAFPLLIIILLLVFRAVGPVLITMVTAAVCLAGAQGIGTLVSWNIDTSNFYITAGSLIGLAVSVDYCLFLLSRYKESLAQGQSANEALRTASSTVGHAIRFGGLCVVAALCALFWARNMVFSSIAAAGVVVTIVAIAAVSTFVPALIAVLGDKVFFGKLPGFVPAVRPSGDRDVKDSSTYLNDRTPVSLRRSGLVTIAVIAPLLMAAAPLASLALRVPVASASILPEGTDSRVGIEVVNGELDARELFPTSVIVRDSENVHSFIDRLAEIPEVLDVIGPDDPAAQFVGMALTGVGEDHSYSRILLTATGAPDSEAAHDMVSTVKETANRWEGDTGESVFVMGATVGGVEFDRLVENSIPWVVSIVAILSLVLLGWAFRSWFLPFLAVLLNALVVAAAIGLLSFLWRIFTGSPINSVTPLVIFAIVFGLSMDYMVLMAARMKEEWVRGRDHAMAIAVGVQKTSRLVISAAIIMIGVFLSFMVAKISIIQELGLGLAMAVALDALVVRPLLFPAILGIVGERVWGRRVV